MLTVSMVAILATAALDLQYRAYEVEKAERQRVQASWLLHGAMDWARLVLREDARAGGVDHLGEPWAVPLSEAKLSEFLAANKTGTVDSGAPIEDAFLSGEIIDLQARLNLANLVGTDGRRSDPDFMAFQRLFSYLGLPAQELERATDMFVAARTKAVVTAGAPLLPQRVGELTWVGLSPATVAALQPYVTLLPDRTALNLNTASPEALSAALDLSLADAQKLTGARSRAPFRTLTEAAAVLGLSGQNFARSEVAVSVATQYFQIYARLRMDDSLVEQRWVVRRTTSQVHPLWME